MNKELIRYARQVIYPPIGEAGQRALLAAHVTIIGAGATGSVLANHLARAGVGHLRLVDRDFPELNNLQRQLLYDEADVAAGLPKAVAAAARLRAINSSIEVEGVVADVNAGNILDLIADADVVLDGSDNFATRYLINDACVKLGKPWVYSGVLAAYGMTMTIRPGVTPCLRCAMSEPPVATATCDTAGILGTIVAVIGSIAATEAVKLIVGPTSVGPDVAPPALNDGMIYVDLWDNTFERFDLGDPLPDCPTCGRHEYPYLAAEQGARTTLLCGRDAVQVSVLGPDGALPALDLAELANRLSAAGAVDVHANPYLLQAHIENHAVTVFADGRAIIQGAGDEAAAATLYARYIGM
jgi:molybdopterin-synthase adenylyltransferase